MKHASFMVGVVHRILGAGGAIAEVPKQVIIGLVDFDGKSDGIVYAVLEAFVGLDDLVVEGETGAEVNGIGADKVGIAFGMAKAVHVGVEAIGT